MLKVLKYDVPSLLILESSKIFGSPCIANRADVTPSFVWIICSRCWQHILILQSWERSWTGLPMGWIWWYPLPYSGELLSYDSPLWWFFVFFSFFPQLYPFKRKMKEPLNGSLFWNVSWDGHILYWHALISEKMKQNEISGRLICNVFCRVQWKIQMSCFFLYHCPYHLQKLSSLVDFHLER